MKYLLENDKTEFQNVLNYINENKQNRKADKEREPLRLLAMFCKHDLDVDFTIAQMNDKKMTIEKYIEYSLKYHDLKFVPEIRKIELQDESYKVVATAYYSEPEFLSYLEKQEYFEKLNWFSRKYILNILQLDDRDIEIINGRVCRVFRGINKYDAHLIGDIISKYTIMPKLHLIKNLEYVKRNINTFDYE
jgi:hypothetical protein